MRSIRLECTTGGSNKFYELSSIGNNGRFTVTALYGAIGKAPTPATVYDGDDHAAAHKAFDKKKLEKLKKGYRDVSELVVATSAPASTDDVPIIWPMNCLGVKNDAQLQQFMDDDDYMWNA